MPSIADSDAVYDISRILPQHQAALTLLNVHLQNPAVHKCQWLDLACGKGQIIAQLGDNLTGANRAKLFYTGYDINIDHTRTAERIADNLMLANHRFFHGDLDDFTKVIPDTERFDFITCTNTAHELKPGSFARILVDAIVKLNDNGQFFLYDMESLTTPELGALPWRAADIGLLVNEMFMCLGVEFRVQPSTWAHKTCKGWTITVQRQFIGKSDKDLASALPDISARLEKVIDKVLDARMQECNKLLESYCRFGSATAEDATSRLLALYEFWAIHRAKGVRK